MCPNICAGPKAIARRCGSARACDQRDSVRDDFGETFGRLVGGKLGWIDPARIVEFVVEDRFAFEPPRGKTHDDEMTFDPAFLVAHDRFAVPGKCNGLDIERSLLAHL